MKLEQIIEHFCSQKTFKLCNQESSLKPVIYRVQGFRFLGCPDDTDFDLTVVLCNVSNHKDSKITFMSTLQIQPYVPTIEDKVVNEATEVNRSCLHIGGEYTITTVLQFHKERFIAVSSNPSRDTAELESRQAVLKQATDWCVESGHKFRGEVPTVPLSVHPEVIVAFVRETFNGKYRVWDIDGVSDKVIGRAIELSADPEGNLSVRIDVRGLPSIYVKDFSQIVSFLEYSIEEEPFFNEFYTKLNWNIFVSDNYHHCVLYGFLELEDKLYTTQLSPVMTSFSCEDFTDDPEYIDLTDIEGDETVEEIRERSSTRIV